MLNRVFSSAMTGWWQRVSGWKITAWSSYGDMEQGAYSKKKCLFSLKIWVFNNKIYLFIQLKWPI
jgi:hypothetical protein